MKQDIFSQLPAALLPWYDEKKRDLPWRKDREPYHVWLSEVMLQQTRVEAVRGYYCRFLEALPTVQALASCEDDVLHKLWEGLGYYSRVRNLKKCANVICNEYAGVFPHTYEEILALPGIGEYTAGAICSICYDLPTPAVDGNVMRVITRITKDFTPIDTPTYKRQVQQALKNIYPTQAGNFTQALMELGATLCGPNRKPDCGNCPCRNFCQAAGKAVAEQLPVKMPKKEKKTEEMTVFIASCEGAYALQKRPSTGLLASMWEFPHVHGRLELPQALQAAEDMGLTPRDIHRQVERNHIFTHIRWEMRGFYLETEKQAENYVWLTPAEIQQDAALPTAFRQFWEELSDV